MSELERRHRSTSGRIFGNAASAAFGAKITQEEQITPDYWPDHHLFAPETTLPSHASSAYAKVAN
jgi:hypothetical protein